MDNETIAVIIIFGTPLALMLAGTVWWAWKDKDNLDLIDHTNELLESMNKNEFYLSSFGEDQEGELFIINYSGEVYSITK